MGYPQIDPSRIRVLPLEQRTSYVEIEQAAVDPASAPPDPGALAPQIERLAERVRAARQRGAAVMLAYGAHLIKNGGGPLLIELLRGGWITHLATQGAGIIHDFEFALIGRSSESVRDNTPLGRFGTWDQTGRWINLAALAGAAEEMGLGEAVGRLVFHDGLTLPPPERLEALIRADPAHPLSGARADLLHAMGRWNIAGGKQSMRFPWMRYSVLAATYAARVPLTVHVGIGYDIFTNHPLFHGGAIGRTSAMDARVFAGGVCNLSGGVYLSVGSAIMSPQVFEKAMSLANNLLQQEGRQVRDHTIAVVDLQEGGGWDWSAGEPPKDNPAYYLRFCKTFHRMGGTLEYLCGDNRLVLHNLLAALNRAGSAKP